MGGHSGDDINKGRANANKIIVCFLEQLSAIDYQLAAIQGGNLRNAIAREGVAIVTLPKANTADFETYLNKMNDTYKSEFHISDPGVEVCFKSTTTPKRVLNEELQVDVMNCLYACPHGVIAMSQDIKDFVETSTNLASVKIENDKIVITTSQRSSVESRKQDASLPRPPFPRPGSGS